MGCRVRGCAWGRDRRKKAAAEEGRDGATGARDRTEKRRKGAGTGGGIRSMGPHGEEKDDGGDGEAKKGGADGARADRGSGAERRRTKAEGVAGKAAPPRQSNRPEAYQAERMTSSAEYTVRTVPSRMKKS